MEKGDYMVHVHIQKARQLNLPGEESVDPFIEVSCLHQNKYTNTKSDITNEASAVYDEHLFFDFRDLKQEEIENAKISLVCKNKGFFQGDVIGLNEL